MTASNKVYDTTTAATLNNSSDTMIGVVAGHNNGGGTSDVVTLGTGSASGTFASPNVANGITVNTSGFTISGADAGNYTLTNPSTTANITPAGLTVTASNISGTYGTSAANTLNGTTGFSETGLLGGQAIGSVTLATNATTSTSGNDNAGSWTITPSSATGGTFNANNYSITYDTGTQTIAKAALTISGMTASNKTYDSTTTATVNNSGDSLSGVVAGLNNGGGTSDAVSLTGTGSTSGTFSSANAGTWTVTGSGLAISGADAGNYTLTQPTASATISPAALTVTAYNKTITVGQPDPQLTYGYTGLVSGDSSASFIGALARTGNDNIGTYSILQNTLAATGNYTIATFNPGVFTINAAPSAPTIEIPNTVARVASQITPLDIFTNEGVHDSGILCDVGGGTPLAGTSGALCKPKGDDLIPADES